MTTLDWIVVAFTVLLAVNGRRQGFIVGALQLAGFAVGALLGSRIGPLLLQDGADSPYAPLFALCGAVLLGTFFGGWLQVAGAALRARLRLPGLDAVDGGLGAVLGAFLALGIAWIVGAVALQTPGIGLRRDAQHSQILGALNDALPPSGPVLNALARFDPLPQFAGPSPQGVAAPPPRIARDPDVRGAGRSVVRVLGTACGLAIEGSGWVARDGLVVTNAHVVAGENDTTVELGGRSPGVAAQAVAFDATDDVAVLRAPGLDAPGLSLAASPESGTPAAILGYPENGPLTAEGARVGRTQTVLTDDAYGRGPVTRLLTPLRGRVRSGNSGGPVIDRSGRVLTTVFAGTLSGPRGGYGVANSTIAT